MGQARRIATGFLMLVSGIGGSNPVAAQSLSPPTQGSPSANPQLDAQIDAFFKTLPKDPKSAIQKALGWAPDFQANPAPMTNLEQQIQNAFFTYGPPKIWEMVDRQATGTLFEQRYYLLQHEKIITRWEFGGMRLPDGWHIAYLVFDGQARLWSGQTPAPLDLGAKPMGSLTNQSETPLRIGRLAVSR